MWLETRKKQDELLKYRKANDIRWIEINTNLTENGFDHYISVDTKETSKDFEKIIIPQKDYVVFKTENCSYPTAIYMDLRKQIFSKGFENSKYELDKGL